MRQHYNTCKNGRSKRQRAVIASLLIATTGLFVINESLSPKLDGASVELEMGLEAVDREEPFKFFAIIHSNRETNKIQYGFDTLFPIVYSHQLWPTGADREQPNLGYITQVLTETYGGNPPERLIINIEHWPVGIRLSRELRAESIEKYIAVLKAARAALPHTKFGLYSILPIREYWVPVNGRPEALVMWEAANRQMMALADHVDFVAPSLYTFYHDRAGWRRYARANIEAARLYGKPVYPFLWPRYHSSNNFYPESLIEQSYFDMQLRLVRRLADSVIVWNGPYKRWELPMSWFEKTRETIEELRTE